jgi:hypothetical protein
MHVLFFLSGAALFCVGLAMMLTALRYRTPACPRYPIFNPRRWKMVWNMQDWYEPKGYRLNLIGWALASAGCLLLAIAWSVPS